MTKKRTEDELLFLACKAAEQWYGSVLESYASMKNLVGTDAMVVANAKSVIEQLQAYQRRRWGTCHADIEQKFFVGLETVDIRELSKQSDQPFRG